MRRVSAGRLRLATSRRLAATVDELGRQTDYEYDNLGRRTIETASAPDATPPRPETRSTFDAVGNRTSVTDPLGFETRYGYDSEGNRTTKFSDVDKSGTIRDIVSGNAADRGKVVEHRQFDRFGKILARTASSSPGAAALPGSGVGVAFGYTGRPIEEKTGLSDDRARWYDANTGRLINEDPSGIKGGDTNLFRSVGNDPLDRVDPSGLTAKWAGGAKGSVPAAAFGAYGAGTLLTSGAGNSTPTPLSWRGRSRRRCTTVPSGQGQRRSSARFPTASSAASRGS